MKVVHQALSSIPTNVKNALRDCSKQVMMSANVRTASVVQFPVPKANQSAICADQAPKQINM